jgi:RND family efflux transporter MFP subunit
MMRSWVVLAGVTAAGLAVGGARSDDLKPPLKEPYGEIITHKVQREKLALDVFERGALDAAEGHDVICRARTGPEGRTLLWVIEDGARVKPGQLLVKLDDSVLQELARTQKAVLDQAKAAAVVAEESAKFTVSQNESDVEAVKVAVQLAELDLKKFEEGDYPQTLNDVRGRKQVAEAELQVLRDQAETAERLVKGGTITQDEARVRRGRLLAGEVVLQRINEELRVLEQFTRPRARYELEARLAEGRRTLDRARALVKARTTQAEAERAARGAVLQQEEARYREIEDEIRQSQIVAPREGLVVYHVPDPAPGGGSAAAPVLAVGEPVREGQKLMRIPDLSRLVVNVRVPEAVIARVRVGQATRVRIDAFPGRDYSGKVSHVSPVPSRQDWRTADVKTYPVQVALDEAPAGAKPHMSADVTLSTSQSAEDVLTVPVQALLVPTGAGQRLCVVRTPGGLEQREVVLGPGNGKMVAVRSGLKEGEEVVLNPRSLYVERPDLRRRP